MTAFGKGWSSGNIINVHILWRLTQDIVAGVRVHFYAWSKICNLFSAVSYCITFFLQFSTSKKCLVSFPTKRVKMILQNSICVCCCISGTVCIRSDLSHLLTYKSTLHITCYNTCLAQMFFWCSPESSCSFQSGPFTCVFYLWSIADVLH